MSFFVAAALLAASAPALAASDDDQTAVARGKPHELIVDKSLDPATLAAMLAPVEAFYGFWNNGSQALLDQAISQSFTDRTLPPGRPQGPKGPMVAMKGFLAAVPDLRCTTVQRLVVGDRVVNHERFTGHFTGTFKGLKGRGQAVDFIATDILAVRDGKITDNWHIEDNLTFQKQIGFVK